MLLLFAPTLLASAGVALVAEEPLKGIWTLNVKECAVEEGPSSQIFIDLAARERGKSGPIVDRYENHCRVLNVHQANVIYTLRLKCYEFWDDYRADENSSFSTMKIVARGTNALAIDGAADWVFGMKGRNSLRLRSHSFCDRPKKGR